MDCPGQYLKRERKLREVSLEDISREIRVPVRLLTALENDDYQDLPHKTFVKGFITAYCKYLGLDENDAVLRYELYLREVSEFEANPAPAPNEPSLDKNVYNRMRKVKALALVVIGVLIIAVIYLFSSGPSPSGHLADTAKSNGIATKKTKPPKDVESVTKKKSKQKVAKPSVALKKQARKVSKKERTKQQVVKKKKTNLKAVSKTRSKPDADISVGTSKAPSLAIGQSAPIVEGRLAEKPSLSGDGREHILSAHASALTWMRLVIDSAEPFEVMLRPGEKVRWKGKVFFCS